MKTYYVSSWAGWFVVEAKDKQQARSEGVREFGRSYVKTVRIATEDEVKSFLAQKGRDALERVG